uniref:Secreted protein n=1 Tax=Oryza sativa subsp. japonica TaxID=39947 RepID=Q6EN66_ORYSJ|nr:hypothetical protein [Oryza sativa Japonica Group]BAD29669.1 hypothetical protein [Oryza sativa Japonica Group]
MVVVVIVVVASALSVGRREEGANSKEGIEPAAEAGRRGAGGSAAWRRCEGHRRHGRGESAASRSSSSSRREPAAEAEDFS